MNRRQFGNLFLGGSFLATAAAFLFPIVRYILPPKQAESSQKRVAAGKVKDFSPNSGKIFKFGSTPAMLIDTAEGQFLAFSAVCTHLTCRYGGLIEALPARGTAGETAQHGQLTHMGERIGHGALE